MGISCQRITNAGPDFFLKDIFDYDIVFLITHGSYDKTSNTHWLLTSNEVGPNSSIKDYLEKNQVYSPNKLSYEWVIEERNGKRYAIYYTCVSDKLIASSRNKFKYQGAILFNSACQSLKDNENMAIAFIEKGAICYLGYTDSNTVGNAAGYEFYSAMLNGCCIERAHESISDLFKEEIIYYNGQTYHPELKLVKAANDVLQNCIVHAETLSPEDHSPTISASIQLSGRIKKLHPDYLADNSRYGFQISLSSDMSDAEDKKAEKNNYDEASLYMNWEKTLDENDLQPNTTYYYRAYMNDGCSNCYGEVKSFTTLNEPKPVTLHVENVTETNAKIWGKIENHELMDKTMRFGLGFKDPEKTNNVLYDVTSIDSDGTFSVELKDLKPNTTYVYFAYLALTSGKIYGEKKEFTTEEFREPYYVWNEKDSTATYYYDGKRFSRGGNIISNQPSVQRNSKKVIFDSSFTYFYPKGFWFSDCEKLQSIDNLNYLNTDSITNMIWMFYRCKSLRSLDLSDFNTSNVTNMSNMFVDCKSLKSLDLSSFNTSNVTNMSNMFAGCNSLKSLDLSSFNTEKVTSISYIFFNCVSLTTLDLSSFKFSSEHVSIHASFNNCSSLKTIYAGNWNFRGSYEPAIFWGCPNLTGGMGTKIGDNYYYDEKGNLRSYHCDASWGSLARIDGGKDRPGLFTEK